MSYTTLLKDTCTVYEDTGTVQNAYGNIVADWQAIPALTDIDCRLESPMMRGEGGFEVKVGAEVVVADYKLFLASLGITEQHRVILDGVTYEVLMVESFSDFGSAHHKRCWLRTVR